MEASLRAKELFDAIYDKVEDANIECGQYCLGGSFDKRKVAKECALVTVLYLKNENAEFFGMVGQTFNNDYWADVENELIKL